MANCAIGIPVVFFLFLLIFAIPTIMGVYVYRDAKQRGMNAMLWTLISILAPGFVGFIIYLIIRSEHSDLRCKSCSNIVKSSFAVCPYCGASLKDHCPNCGFTLEADWAKCPECGEDIPEEIKQSRQNSTKNDKGLKGILLAVILIPLALCVMMFLAMCSFSAFANRGSSSSSIAMSSISDLGGTDITQNMLSEWIAECDKAGPGAYALRAEENRYYETGDHLSAMLIYCNNGYYIEEAYSEMGGWFTDASAIFECYPIEGQTADDLPVLMFYEYISDEPCYPKVLCDGKAVDVQITDADWSYFAGFSSYYYSNMYIEVNVDESAEHIYSISCDYYAGEEIAMGEGATCADGSSAAGETFFFTYPLDEYDDITSVVITAYDKYEDPLFSDKFSVADYPAWTVNIMTDENGGLAAKIQEKQ